MLKLDDREWATFEIGMLFDVQGTTTTKPSRLIADGTTPRITCSAMNNGLDGFYQNDPTEQGGVLTVDSAAIGYVAFQEHDFIATDHVEKLVLKGRKLTRALGLFFVTEITFAIQGKFNYGYKFSQNRICRQRIALPVASTGEPDYQFMEEYVREMIGNKV